ncbi:MAG: citramalate synthase [alpha proteobacterium MED-G09]|nr:MAG: citramalate synthase [alpha proteobacterium MED-G09]
MIKEKIYLFDTTLRDGQQTQGVDFSVDDKVAIAKALDDLGLDYIEGGWPGANPTDTSFFETRPKFKNSKFTAFGMTKRSGRSADNDPQLRALIDSGADSVCLVAKTWDYHVDVALGISLDENLLSIKDSVNSVRNNKIEPLIDCEHFFDGFKANPDFSLSCIDAALSAQAKWVVLCDTNGGTLPNEIFDIVSKVSEKFSGENIGIHCHNDTENAVANSLAAIDAGARQIQGTLNGLGERCGNANLISLIPTLLLKDIYSKKYDISISKKDLKSLKNISLLLDGILNRQPNKHQPYVGDNAFAHKGGLHVSAVMKDPSTYEHENPEEVGNTRKILVSNQAGKSNLLSRLSSVGIEIKNNDERLNELLEVVKEKEFRGYSYDGAGASFELLAKNILDKVPNFFSVSDYEISIKKQNSNNKSNLTSEAFVKVSVEGREIKSNGKGNGPVNALDKALRGDLGIYDDYLKDLVLVDYKVRILNGGTEAITRVVIESIDKDGSSWFTVGVSPNIVEASLKALMDSIQYKLIKDDAPLPKKC